jgi:hypothetical protein
VRHGSNQSVAEFYGQFYSNSDLKEFLSLTGLREDSLPVKNILGDNGNDEKKPGGEGQLDIEYLMVCICIFYVFISAFIYVCMNVCVFLCICMYIYVYIYIYVHIYIYICIYIYV